MVNYNIYYMQYRCWQRSVCHCQREILQFQVKNEDCRASQNRNFLACIFWDFAKWTNLGGAIQMSLPFHSRFTHKHWTKINRKHIKSLMPQMVKKLNKLKIKLLSVLILRSLGLADLTSCSSFILFWISVLWFHLIMKSCLALSS